MQGLRWIIFPMPGVCLVLELALAQERSYESGWGMRLV